MTHAEKLKVIRKKLQLSQGLMATKLGIKQSYYSEIERGEKEISGNVTKRLFESCAVSPDWFYNETGDIFINANSDINEKTIKELNSGFVSKMINETKNNPNYAIAKNLYFKMSGDHNQDLKRMAITFSKFIENTKILMQFIRQYDFIINHPAPYLNIMYLLNEKDEKEVEKEFADLFSNLPKVLTIISKLNGAGSHCIEDLSKYDMHNELGKKYFEDARKLRRESIELLSKDKSKAQIKEYEAIELELIYDLLLKDYPKITE